jgi:hypothetical protein
MTTRSPRGFSFLLVAVAVANAQFLLKTAADASRPNSVDLIRRSPAQADANALVR